MFSLGDLASAFGCTVGLKDAVTAITLVALGTSLPDTFASKVAAVNDKFADSSVGNVTGSNAVNVFLGVGVAWFTAAVYHEVKGMVNFRIYFKKKDARENPQLHEKSCGFCHNIARLNLRGVFLRLARGVFLSDTKYQIERNFLCTFPIILCVTLL